jgi:calcineurin-like phosphoesterase family protein
MREAASIAGRILAMNYWVISDTHFGHARMMEFCGRPEGFERRIQTNLRAHLNPSDVLFHLGDICIGDDAYWNERLIYDLPGKKVLIKGNHDRKSTSWYYRIGWDCVVERLDLEMFGHRLVLSHRPVQEPGNFINIHGHHHNVPHHPEDSVDDRHRLVCLEHEYRPVTLRSLIERRTGRRQQKAQLSLPPDPPTQSSE